MMLFLLLIPVLAVAVYRLHRANTKVRAILCEELPDAAPWLTVPLNPGAFRPARPITIGTSAGRVGSP